jgi:opine dehydrogenase
MRFSVIGAGSGGRAFCAYISSKGFEVSLYNRSLERIKEIKKKGGIKASGELKGFFKIKLVTQEIEDAIRDSEVILVVTPASAHKEIAKLIAPYITPNQIIILNPGRTFGAVEFKHELEKEREKIPKFIGETQTLLFTARQLEGNGVNIFKIKKNIEFSTYPEKYVNKVYKKLKNVFHQIEPVKNYLEMTLYNIGMLLHPTISLLNAGSIDYGKKLKFYYEGASYNVSKVLEEIELEIRKIFGVLRLKRYSFINWAQEVYGTSGDTIYKTIQQIKPYKNIFAPNKLITRYLTEDIPTGLVPLSSLGEFLGVSTPTINSIIHLSSVLCNIDFRSQGRTIENLRIHDYLGKILNDLKLSELDNNDLGEIAILNNEEV